MGLADGLVVSAAALLWPAVANDVVDVVVAGVAAGLLMAPLYRLKNEEATAEVAVVSMACGQWYKEINWGNRNQRTIELCTMDPPYPSWKRTWDIYRKNPYTIWKLFME